MNALEIFRMVAKEFDDLPDEDVVNDDGKVTQHVLRPNQREEVRKVVPKGIGISDRSQVEDEWVWRHRNRNHCRLTQSWLIFRGRNLNQLYDRTTDESPSRCGICTYRIWLGVSYAPEKRNHPGCISRRGSMSVRITDTVTADGRKFQKMLKELAEKEVRVGFQHGKATEEDGTDICDIAAWNELGTVHIPARPFLRMSVDDNTSKIKSFLQEKRKDLVRGVSAEQVLKEIGIFQKDLIQEKITDGSFAPNAASTVKKKGSSKPLIDTGRMRQSVNYEIKQKGSGD